MNKTQLALLMLVVGLGAGWLGRGALQSSDQTPARQTARREAPRAEPHRLPLLESDAAKPEQETVIGPASVPVESESSPAATAAESPVEKKRISFLESQIPQARLSAEKDARGRAAKIAAKLGLDEARSEQLTEVIAQHSGEAAARILGMLFGGEEISDEALQAMEDGFGIDQALEHDLSLFLTSEEVLAVRAETNRISEERTAERVESELASLALPDLSEGQANEVRGVLREERSTGSIDVMRAMTRVFSDPESAKGLADDEEFLETLDAGYAGRREKLRGILNDAQFKQYETWERKQKEQTRTAVRMLGMLNEMKVLDGDDSDGAVQVGVRFER